MRFEYWKSKFSDLWYWHLRAANGEIIANGEGYENKADCLSTIEAIKQANDECPIVEVKQK